MHLDLPVVLALALAAAAPESPPAASGTWILQIEGEAGALGLTGAAHKPSAYRAPRQAKREHRLELIDADGARIGVAPLDLSKFCLDPDHRGQQPHVKGDVVVGHRVSATVKIPALPGTVELRIVAAASGEPGSGPRVLARISRAALDAQLERSAKKKEVR